MLEKSKIEAILQNLNQGEAVSLIECVEKSAKVVGENWCNNLVNTPSLKARLHMPFPHAFSAVCCDFQIIMLVSLNQGKY
jgi:hypothetical protein